MCHQIEQLPNLLLSFALLGSCWVRQPLQKCQRYGNVLTRVRELQWAVIVRHDPPVYITGHGMGSSSATVVACDLVLEVLAIALQLTLRLILLPCL